MKVIKVNYVKKIESLKLMQKQRRVFAENVSDKISFRSNPVETGKVLTKIVGSFSKEDFIKVEKLISELKNLTSSELIGLKNNLIKQNTDRLKAAGMQFKIDNNRELCGYNNLLVTSNLKKELKQNSLKLFALNKLLFSVQQTETLPLAQSIFEHPVDKALRITGDFTKEDIFRIKNKEKKYSALEVNRIYENKTCLIDKIKTYCTKKDLSERDFSALKKLAIEYTALNNVQKQKGLFTKDLERVLNASSIPADIKSGDFIDGLGVVTDRLEVDGRDSVIVLSNINKSQMLKMYDLKELNRRLVDDGSDLNTMNERAKGLIQGEEKSSMAQVQFTPLAPEYLEKLTGIKEEKQSYYVGDFLNYDRMKYPKAAKIIALRLLKLFNDKQYFPVYLKAHAYHGSKHSPVNFYRYYGLTPISHTEEEIEKLISQNNGKFPYEIPVYFCLRNFDAIKDRFLSWLKTYSI
mgnify:FL=1